MVVLQAQTHATNNSHNKNLNVGLLDKSFSILLSIPGFPPFLCQADNLKRSMFCPVKGSRKKVQLGNSL